MEQKIIITNNNLLFQIASKSVHGQSDDLLILKLRKGEGALGHYFLKGQNFQILFYKSFKKHYFGIYTMKLHLAFSITFNLFWSSQTTISSKKKFALLNLVNRTVLPRDITYSQFHHREPYTETFSTVNKMQPTKNSSNKSQRNKKKVKKISLPILSATGLRMHQQRESAPGTAEHLVPRALPPWAEHLVPRALPPWAEHLV